MMILHNQSMQRLYLVDGSSFVFRSFHALPELRTADGTPTGAVYGFVNMIQGLLDEYHPEYMVVAFDRPEPTFRHEVYAAYKANRVAPPEELTLQFPLIKEALAALRIAVWECPGLEADDLLGSLSVRAEAEGFEVVIVSGDKDLLQLAAPHVQILQSHFKHSRLYGEKEVIARYHCPPERLPDLFGLMGDSVDNIPGVPGIGEKTAMALIEQFGDLESIYARVGEVQGKRRQLLQEHREQAFLSRALARIKTDIAWELPWESARVGEPDRDKLAELYKRLQFKRLLARLPRPALREQGAVRYRTVSTAGELEALGKALRAAGGAFAVDTETTGLDPLRDTLVGISISTEAGQGCYLPIGHETGGNLPHRALGEHLGPVLADAAIGKYGHHLKFDSAFLKQAKLPLAGMEFDTLVASHLLEPGRDSHALDALARDRLGMEMTPIEELIGSGKTQKSMAEVEIARASDYACEDADATLRLVQHYRERIESEGLAELFYEIEMPLIGVLRDMELAGVLVDAEELGRQSEQLEEQLDGLEGRIHRLAGVEFNVNSPKQLSGVLYDRLGLRAGRKRSTAVGVLEKLAAEGHEIASCMIEYRQLSKLKSTYLDALPQMIHLVTGRVHTSYRQTGAATGRISSSEPNLQNIPIRTDVGRRIRKAFQAPPGALLLSADYSQIELRILAHLSQDPGLLRAFEADEDIHSFTAREVFDLKAGEPVPAEARRRAKAINFGLNYGMTPYGLAQRLGIEPGEAEEYMTRYFARYPRVLEFVESIKETAREQGYVRTLKGRRVPTLEVRSSNHLRREAAERAAINAPMQGSAADLLKLAMVQVARMLDDEGLSTRMILTVHDEIIFEVPLDELETLKGRVKAVMEGVVGLWVPLKADLKWGLNWADL